MKIDYQRFKQLNFEALTAQGDQLSSFWIIQSGVERYLQGEGLTEQHKEFLIDLGVLIESDEVRKNIVGPFKFSEDGSSNI